MIAFITQPENSIFLLAILVMFGIAILEGVFVLLGFGVFQFLDTLMPNIELNTEVEFASDIESPSALSRFFSWLRIGKVPLLMLLIVFLTSFGLIGFSIQLLLNSTINYLLPGWLISLPALLLSLPIVSGAGKFLEKIIPNDETDAITEDSLVGRVATITIGTAKKDYAAQARVTDQFGHTHYIMVEPDQDHEEFQSGSEVLLIKNQGTIFSAILNPNSSLTD